MIDGRQVVEIARRAARPWRARVYLETLDDAEQDAAEAYLVAARERGGDPLPDGYALIRCRGAIVDAMRRASGWSKSRKSGPMFVRPCGDEWDRLTPAEPAPAEEIADADEARKRTRDMRKAIDALPDELRRIIRAHYWQEQTLGEIGAATGAGAARTWQQHEAALAHLRHYMRRTQ